MIRPRRPELPHRSSRSLAALAVVGALVACSTTRSYAVWDASVNPPVQRHVEEPGTCADLLTRVDPISCTDNHAAVQSRWVAGIFLGIVGGAIGGFFLLLELVPHERT